MSDSAAAPRFTGAVAEIYDSHLVPMIFQPYADDLARRLGDLGPSRVLEVAAGTGAVTRTMAARLPESVSIVATDLSPSMIEHAQRRGTARPVEWQVADALALPFGDAAFDAVVCQFGAMFFPDRPKGFAEAHRVLQPDGWFVFSVWDGVATNDFARVISAAIAARYPDDPPLFMERIPHGYHDPAQIRADLAAAGFGHDMRIDEVPARSRGASSNAVAAAYCYGTPMRNFLESRGPGHIEAATSAAADAVAAEFGRTDLEAGINAFVVTARVVDR